MILYILRGHPGGGARRTPELMVLRTCHVRVKVMSVEVLVPVKVPCYCSWSQRVCVPHSISHTGPLQNSTHHWQWSMSCNKGPVKVNMILVLKKVSKTLAQIFTSGAVHLIGMSPP